MMVADAQALTMTWDDAVGGWRLTGEAYGPAGQVTIDLHDLTWSCDWSDPQRIVAVTLRTIDGRPSGALHPTSVSLIEATMGATAARNLLSAATVDIDVIVADEATAKARCSMGRLARSLAEIGWARGSSVWSIEAVHHSDRLGLDLESVDLSDLVDHVYPMSALSIADELYDDALTYVGCFGDELLRALDDAGLRRALLSVLRRNNVTDAEYPAPLLLDDVDRRFGELIASGAFIGIEAEESLLIGAIRDASPSDGAHDSHGQVRGEVFGVYVAPGAVESAEWRVDGSSLTVDVVARWSPWGSYSVRLFDDANLADDASPLDLGPVELSSADAPTAEAQTSDGTGLARWTATVELNDVVGWSGDALGLRVELSAGETFVPSTRQESLARHAASLGRNADRAELLAYLGGAAPSDEARRWNVAAQRWAATQQAWLAASEDDLARRAMLRQALCLEAAGQGGIADLLRKRVASAATDMNEQPLDVRAADEAITEQLVAVISAYVTQRVQSFDGDATNGTDDSLIRELLDLEALCDALGLRRYSEQAREMLSVDPES